MILNLFGEDFRRATVSLIRGDAVCVMGHAGLAGEAHSTGIGLLPGSSLAALFKGFCVGFRLNLFQHILSCVLSNRILI